MAENRVDALLLTTTPPAFKRLHYILISVDGSAVSSSVSFFKAG